MGEAWRCSNTITQTVEKKGGREKQEHNVINGLEGLGIDIFIHVIHETKTAAEVRQFLIVSKSTSKLMKANLFNWSLSQSLSHSYPISSIPTNKVDLVCFLVLVTYSVLFLLHLGWICELLCRPSFYWQWKPFVISGSYPHCHCVWYDPFVHPFRILFFSFL